MIYRALAIAAFAVAIAALVLSLRPSAAIDHRDRLSSNRAYFISAGGSDYATCARSQSEAFPSPQQAWSFIANCLDLAGHDVEVQIADGEYNVGLDAMWPQTGAGLVTFVGNLREPSKVKFAPPKEAFMARNYARFQVAGMEIQAEYAAVEAADFGTAMVGQSVIFGPSALYHMRAVNHAFVSAQKTRYLIAGGAGKASINAAISSTINLFGSTIAIAPGRHTFETFALADRSSIVNANEAKAERNGEVMGARFMVVTGSTIWTGDQGRDFFPGDKPGVGDGTGNYDGTIVGEAAALN